MTGGAHRGRQAALVVCALLYVAGSASAQPRVFTNTESVSGLALDTAGALWVSTSGGVERYDAEGRGERRHYTTLDGLDSNDVLGITIIDGMPSVRTAASRCRLVGERFECERDDALSVARPSVSELFEGRRVTAQLETAALRFVGTAGAGVWRIDGGSRLRLTPEGQICSNHITDVIEWEGRTWLGSFDDGLCYREGDEFVRVEGPFRMINDLEVSPGRIWVASTEGLYFSRNGRRWVRIRESLRGVNGLAFDGSALWVTTPGSLHRLKLSGSRGPRSRGWWRPGGAAAVQDLALGPGGVVWLATEDLGAIRFEPDDEGGEDRARIFDRAAGMPTSWALGIDVDAEGRAFVATLRHGVVMIDPGGDYQAIAGPSSWMFRVRVEGGRVWLGTQGGASSVGDAGVSEEVRALPDPRVHEIRRVGGLRYVGTEGGLLTVPVG